MPQPSDVTRLPRTKPDVCSENLHELAGAMLQFCIVNQKIPARLEDLAPFTDAGKPLPLACPVSRERYVFVPEGLEIPNNPDHLILFDPQPSHNGKRWAIITRPAEPPKPIGLWVVELDELTFARYRPVP